jgi:anti-anti-sigma factor
MSMSVSCLRPVGIIDAEKGHHLLAEVRSRLSFSDATPQITFSLSKSQFHIDFSEVDFVDEQGLDCLLQMLDTVSKAQGQLLLLSVNDPVRYLFAAKGLNFFDLFPKKPLPSLRF